MGKKEFLKKQNQRNVLSKKNRERILAALLAGSISAFTVSPQAVYASSIETYDASSTVQKASKTIVYNKVFPSKIVLDGIDLSEKTVANVTLSNTPAISGDRLQVTKNSIIIPQDVVESLNLRTTKYNTSINFEDGTYLSGAFFIQVIEDVDAPPADTTPDDGIVDETPEDNTNPPAETPDDEIKDDVQNNAVPEITKAKKVFDYESPEDVVINDVDLKGLDITKVFIGTVEVDKSYVECDNDSITISKEAFKRLSLNNGTRSVKFVFSNGYVFEDALEIETINNTDKVSDTEIDKPVEDNKPSESVKPEDTAKPEETVKPPVSNDKEENTPAIIKPEFPKQTITFNRDKAEDVVIKDVNAKGLKLTSFYIYGQRIDVNKLTVTENSIIIPKEVIWNLYLKNGKYPMSANYENGTYVSGVAYLEMTDGGSIYPEVSEDTVIKYPEMIKQGFEFDWGNQRGINITYVNFNGTKLKSIKVGHKIIEADGFTTTDNSIHVSAEVLESLRLAIGVYNLSFVFSNGVTVTGYSDLTVVHSKDITRNETPIVIDPVKNEVVEIPNLIPEGTNADSITINNVVVDVFYMDSEEAVSIYEDDEDSEDVFHPFVIVDNGNVYIPAETFEFIGGNSGNYEISVRLDNGTTLIQELSVQSEAVDEDTDNGDSTNNGTSAPEVSDKNDGNTGNTAVEGTIEDSVNDNVVESSNTQVITSSNTKKDTLPKTSDAASISLLASLFGSLSGLAIFKRKRK